MQRGFHLVLVMTLAAALIPNSIRAATEHELQDVSKQAVHPVDGGLVLEWQVLPPSVEINASGETEVSLPGYSLLNQPGVAQVPFASALIALPHGAQPNMEVVASEDQVLDLPAPVR